MRVSPARRVVLSSLSALAAGAVLLAGVATPTSATQTQTRPSQMRPVPRAHLESQPAVDSRADLLRERHAASSRPPVPVGVLARLRTAGADKALGSVVSALVVDVETGRALYSRNPSLAVMPASNHKLTTAYTALQTMGPAARFRTEVKASANRAVLYLVGGGDPALTSAQLRSMAASAKTAVVAAGRSSVSLRVDDDLFPSPTNATGWKTSYVPGDVAPVRPLVVDGRNVMDTALDAGTVFKNELVRLGVAVSSFARGSEPTGTVAIAATVSPELSTLVARMINTSNNDYAEFLHRQSSRTAGKGATWAAASSHAMATLASRGVLTKGVVVQDGSGLSRADRSSATSLASVLLAVSRSSAMSSVMYAANAMPTAGVSGTLATRFSQPDTVCARGKVRAKTGTLNDVTALSGIAYGVDGRRRIFSVVVNGAPDMAAARFAVERFATAATGCTPA